MPARVPIAASFSSRVRGHRLGAGRHPAILDAVPRESQTGEGSWATLLAPLRADPARAAILTDVDGTLAPIVDAGRGSRGAGGGARGAGAAERALRAGRLRLRPPGRGGAAAGRPRRDRLRRQPRAGAAAAGRRGAAARPLAGRAARREAADFVAGLDRERLRAARAAARGQGADPGAALARRRRRGARRGLRPRDRGRRRATPGSNRAGAARCWSCARSAAAARTRRSPRCWPAGSSAAAVYAGDDRTDLDAFRRLRELREEGELATAVCVGIVSPEAPPELPEESDLIVDGPEGWLAILEWLAE